MTKKQDYAWDHGGLILKQLQKQIQSDFWDQLLTQEKIVPYPLILQRMKLAIESIFFEKIIITTLMFNHVKKIYIVSPVL